ncbi:DUF6514 family protein [Bittarella massiliensis (ex Durand et al. 2017)]|uniref:DUF6514 family protein n=1 Tax=Bittarella massiliensis (ex Durand et al. 2017) TaxID=1720313 RepID=UPI001AA176FD|nr:hypothetical protein [Bittarella massiliensis (ex Durand et al. 2017)]
MFQYTVVKEALKDCEIGPYTGYGIRVIEVSSCGSEEVAFVSDVSCERGVVEQLAALCTRLQLYPCHLYDVVLDAIS